MYVCTHASTNIRTKIVIEIVGQMGQHNGFPHNVIVLKKLLEIINYFLLLKI